LKTKLVPVIGVLLITTPRFHDLGEGTEHGVYYKRKEKEAAYLVASLSKFSQPIFTKVVYTREDVKAAIAQFERDQVDMVFACFLSWSDDFAWIRFLRDMKSVPILFASVVRDSLNFTDSLSEDRFVEFLSAGSLVGMLEASGSASRFCRPMMHRIVGTHEQILQACHTFSQAAAMRSRLRQVNFGLLPSLNEVMWSTYVDPYSLFMQIGPELRYISVVSYQQEIASIEESLVRKTTDELIRTFKIDTNVDIDKMRASVAASLALESLSRKYGVEVLVLNDVDPVLLRSIGLRPGFTPCPGTDDIVVVPEGDIGAALAVYILKCFTQAPVQLIEPFHIDYERDVFEGGHAGPNDYTDALGSTIISRDERFARTDYKYAGAPFAWHVISSGEKTMLHISECNGKFKLVCAVIDALHTTHHLAGYTHGLFKPRKPCVAFFQELMQIGVTQHYAIVNGDCCDRLEILADIMGFEFHRL